MDNLEGESEEEPVEQTEETDGGQSQRGRGRGARKATQQGQNQCLTCQKNCTRAQYSVKCTLCELWCHKGCSGLSDEAFKGLDIQSKETGMAFWACRSCLSYAKKVNNQFKKADERMEKTERKVEENKKELEETKQLATGTAEEVKALKLRMDSMVDKMEEAMDFELREREVRRLNVIIHGLEEVVQEVTGNKNRMEEVKRRCEEVFRTLGSRTSSNSMRFCRRIGERGEAPRPVVVGLGQEGEKNFILSKARLLLNTRFSEVTIVPDLTKRQRAGETKLKEEANRRNQQLTQQDRDNNMKWLVVGRRGEKRLIKGVERDMAWRPPPDRRTLGHYIPTSEQEARQRATGAIPRQIQQQPQAYPVQVQADMVGQLTGPGQGQQNNGPGQQQQQQSQAYPGQVQVDRVGQLAGPGQWQQSQIMGPHQQQQPYHDQMGRERPSAAYHQDQRQSGQVQAAGAVGGNEWQNQTGHGQFNAENQGGRDQDQQESGAADRTWRGGGERGGQYWQPAAGPRERLHSKRGLDLDYDPDHDQQARRARH